MKHLLISILITISFCQIAFQQSFLKADGQSIVNEEGENFIFRGMGLGGWMLQEGYMLKTASFANAQHKIKAKIAELIGDEGADEFYDAWLENHTTRKDIAALADWGFNSVRLPMHYNLYTLPIEDEPVLGEDTWLEKGFEMTDSLIEWCRDYGMYVILDLHAAPGGQGRDEGISDYDPTKPSLWESEENQRKTVALWKKLAERYVDEPVVGAYDLINETNWDMDGNLPLRDLFFEITDSIRTVDTKHIIFVEGNWFANDFTNLTPPWDDNIVYSPHKYWSINDEASIQWVLDIREQHNVPIMFGECGENSNVWFKDAITLFEDRNIGWAWWPLKKIDDIAGPLNITRSDDYQTLLDYWENGGSQPSAEFAKTALMDLTEDIKIENCRVQPDVVDAMIRQVAEGGTKGYTDHVIPGLIYASDYDMGSVGEAYFDVQVANYQVSTGSFSAWNNGWSYRNDGVDIEKSQDMFNSNGFNVGWTSKDEWMQYEVDVTENGVYEVKLRIATESGDGEFHLASGTAGISAVTQVSSTTGWQAWESVLVSNVILSESDKKIRLYIDNPTFNVGSMEFTKVGETSSISAGFLSGITLDDKTVQVNVNKALDLSTTSDLSMFELKVDGNVRSITSSVIDENNPRILYFTVDDAFKSQQDIRISYTGSDIKAFDGTTLNTFNLKPVQNTVSIIHALPGKVEMEDYFFQSGIELENTSDDGGGQNIGFLDVGDYADYKVNVGTSALYGVDFRTAALSETGEVKLQLVEESGELINLGSQDFASTGDWQSWATTEGPQFSLSAGEKVIRVTITKPLFNINWMEFSLLSDVEDLVQKEVNVFPNPSSGIINVQLGDDLDTIVKMSVYTSLGERIINKKIESFTDSYNLDLSAYPSGHYNIVFQGREGKLLANKGTLIIK